VKEIKDLANQYDIHLMDLSYCPNNLDPDQNERKKHHDRLMKMVDACGKLDVSTITTFAGRDPNRSMEENMDFFEQELSPLIDYARDNNVKIAVENCPMGFAMYGGENFMYSPKIWKMMFKRFDKTLGLCLDPSHLIWLMIDYIQTVRDFADRIYVVHAKDCEIDRRLLGYGGILDSEWVDVLFTGKSGIGHREIKWKDPSTQWWRYRIPGLGDIDFGRLISELLIFGYTDDLIIEHEDPIWYGTEELNKQGLTIGLRHLSQFLP
jgi:sugar phosphate isomerase/epimerase